MTRQTLRPGTLLRASVVATFIATAALASGAWAANGKPAIDRDTIVFGIGKEIGNLDGQVAASGDSQRYLWQIYDSLYGFDLKGNLKPSVASKVDVAADGLTYTFDLRNDVVFHNGAKLTSRDVKFSMDRILDPATKSTRRPYFVDLVTAIETPTPTKVAFKLSRPDGAFLNKIAGYLVLLPEAYTKALPTVEAFAQAPVGSGPYKFVDRKIGQSVTLQRNDAYWGRKPGIKRLIFKSLPDGSSRTSAILTGEVDIVDYVPPADIDRLRKLSGLTLDSVQVGSPLAVRLYSNVEGTPLSKRQVRLALNHGLDSKAIIDNVLRGVGAPLTSYISTSYPYGVDKTLKPYAYDPARAKKLLAEAGYPNGFSIDFMCPTDNPKELCEAISAYWSQIGVKAAVKTIDYAAWSRLNNTHKSGPMTMMQFSNAIYDPIHPISGGATKAGTWSDYYNPEVEKLVGEVQSITEPAKRDEAFKKIGRLLHDDGHAVLITELHYTYARDSAIQWDIQQGSGYFNLHSISWKK